MIRHAKRNTGILTSLFAMLEGIVLLLVNGIFLVNNILEKISDEAPNLTENLFTFEMDPYTTEYSKAQPKFTIFYVVLFLVGLLLVTLAFKYFRKPVDKKGNITYKKGILFFEIVIAVAVAVLAYLGMTKLKDFNFVDIDKMNIFCYAEISLAAVTVVFAIFTFLIKSNNYKLKTVVKPVYKKKVDVSTLYANDKLQKIEQLKALGAISQKEYNEATAKYTQSV